MYLDWLEEKIDYEKKIGATKSSKNLLVSLILNETIFYTLYFSEAFNSKVFAMLILRKFAQKEVERSKNQKNKDIFLILERKQEFEKMMFHILNFMLNGQKIVFVQTQ